MLMSTKSKILNDRYLIQKYISSGAFSKVYISHDIVKNKKVAIKKIKFKDQIMKEFVEVEIKLLKKLSEWPNCDPSILCIYDYVNDEKNNTIYIITEFIEGHELSVETLTFQNALDIAKQLAKGYCKLHQKGVAHRDIKPSNIVITKNNIAKIIDFGLSCDMKLYLGSCDQPTGTLNYMAPEIINGEMDNLKKSDVYSFGVTLFLMFNKILPYSTSGLTKQEIITKKLSTLPRTSNSGNKDLDKLINSMLVTKASKRPSMKDVVYFLGKV